MSSDLAENNGVRPVAHIVETPMARPVITIDLERTEVFEFDSFVSIRLKRKAVIITVGDTPRVEHVATAFHVTDQEVLAHTTCAEVTREIDLGWHPRGDDNVRTMYIKCFAIVDVLDGEEWNDTFP